MVNRLDTVNDPTYDKSEIDANPVWKLAYFFSELANDIAPTGWSHYIPIAQWLIQEYHND